jgi:hypothetical protein
MRCKITCTARQRFTDKKNAEVNFRVRSRPVSSASDWWIAGLYIVQLSAWRPKEVPLAEKRRKTKLMFY